MASGEFEVIARYLAPLSASAPGAFGLKDDAAALEVPQGEEVVATVDAMVAGVHFLAGDPPATIARKLLRVNLSDLAAMGAAPLAYLLTTAYPKDLSETWIAEFAKGLAQDQQDFGITLIGGDTVSTPGPLSLTLTALGSCPPGQALRRGGGQAGDDLYVSGSLGDAALGLKVLTVGIEGLEGAAAADLASRYRVPLPRLRLGLSLRQGRLASAAMDVSDGLVADLEHLAAASGLAAEIKVSALPRSKAVERTESIHPDLALQAILAGGDDYELVFSAPRQNRPPIMALSQELNLPLTLIGRLVEGQGVRVEGPDGRPLSLSHKGWTHF